MYQKLLKSQGILNVLALGHRLKRMTQINMVIDPIFGLKFPK
ncbi:hypothetical protein D1AOALGA4SA_7898 [Olavius algarvensis Delta 1 endosymbiont]|nr:hypothetical protein D1AOALGA4SA_7898 [Olavius algarvensis Delta 1 endosymbiont]